MMFPLRQLTPIHFLAAKLIALIGVSLSPVLSYGVPLFESEEPIEIRVAGPLDLLKAQRGDNPIWLPGTQVFVKTYDGSEMALDVEIRARGNYRRQEHICPFPPYWLNFKKKQVEGTVFEGQDRIKVVSHCKEGEEAFTAHIYREYLAYKTYNLITDNSFRVRLARIDYEDTQLGFKQTAQVGFFIEHTNGVEDRLSAKEIEDRFVMPSSYDLDALCIAELFQYFVGNTDFNFFASEDECCHNGKAFAFEDGTKGHMPIPYDFDISGIVNTPYAKPNPGMLRKGVETVTQRYHSGVNVPDDVWQRTLVLYQSKKAAIYELWETFEPLDDLARAEALDFIDQFYAVIDDPQQVEEKIKATKRSVSEMDGWTQRRKEMAERF